MKFNFQGDITGLNEGINIISKKMGFEVAPEGKIVLVKNRKGDIEISSDGENYTVYYEEKIHFFRALGLLIEHFGTGFHIVEKVQFKHNGIMIDSSRNGVMKVSCIKNFIEIMAIMGLNLFILYTEDTYEVKELKYFGYMRGRYTHEELHECDKYAEIFGIEMQLCIQTLAHLAKALQWRMDLNITDTADSIMVGEEDTYTFIRYLMRNAVKPFRSRKLHIGMDEAWMLGLGAYLKQYGYRKPDELMAEHLSRVKEIAKEENIEIMMWSDMFFRACAGNNYYNPDVEFTEKIISNVPENAQLVYWDYYNTDVDYYERMIRKHKELTDNVCFAGGIWTWGTMSVNYDQTINASLPALEACIRQGVTDVFATVWGDNGNQTNAYEILYGMQIFAEIGYGHSGDKKWIGDRFKICTGEDANAFLDFTLLDNIGQENFGTANPSEYLLWQDILIGLLDANIDKENISEIYRQRKDRFEQYSKSSKNYSELFLCASKLASVLEIKADLGIRIKKCYDTNDKDGLREICINVLPELKKRLIEWKKLFKKIWLETYKAFGLEVMDLRFGALTERIETTTNRINSYITGEIETIEELDAERLPYTYGSRATGLNMRTQSFVKYYSAGYFSHNVY